MRPIRIVLLIAGILIIAILVVANSCVSFSMSDRKVKEYFAGRTPQPSFHSYEQSGRQIHYAEIGKSDLPTVIFIHGSPGSWDAFAGFFKNDTLLQKAHLISVDRPGFGKSDLDRAEPSLAMQAQLIAPILEKNKPAILVGHSLGGPVAARLAMDYPQLVSGLVLVAGSIDPDAEKYEWYRRPLIVLDELGILPDEIDASNREILPLKAELKQMMPLWNHIHCPVVVIQGEKDDLVPPSNAAFAKRMLTHNDSLTVRLLPGVNHFIPWSHPHEITGAVLRLLKN
jgi:pimeloyl-ACP methyl ester carboxylesterase